MTKNLSIIWLVGVALGLSYASNILIDSTLPFYIKSLGISTAVIANVEGIVLFLTFLSKFIGGMLTDYLGSRKKVVVAGVFFATLSKPLFAFTSFFPFIFANKILDRVSQGFLKGPSDALIGDLASKDGGGSGNNLAASYGIREACARMGALLGTLLGVAVMTYYSDKYYIAFYIATILSFLSLLFYVFFVPTDKAPSANVQKGWNMSKIFDMPAKFWRLMAFIFVAQSTHFATPLLLLRGVDVGIKQEHSPFIIAIMFLVGSVTAIKFGKIADKFGHWKTYLLGLLTLAVAQFLIAYASIPFHMYAAVVVWGVYLAIIQTTNCALVIDYSPDYLRGTGFGIFKMVIGASILIGNSVAGFLWDNYSPATPFKCASVYLLSIILLSVVYDLYNARVANTQR